MKTLPFNWSILARCPKCNALIGWVPKQPLLFYSFTNFFHIASYYVFADMVALPDFAFSGMENWGIIMYREAALLYKPNASSEANKQRTAGILSHELAHQVCFFIRDLLSRRSLTVLLLLQKILLTHGKTNLLCSKTEWQSVSKYVFKKEENQAFQ